MSTKKNKGQARIRLVWWDGEHLHSPPKASRRKKIVEPLNPTNAGVLNIASLKFLEPLESDLCAAREVGPREIAVTQESDGSLKKGLIHAPSLGKTLPECQIDRAPILETHYRMASVIFFHMRAETTEDVLKALSENAVLLKEKYKLSDAKIANSYKDIAPKSVNNVVHGRHSVTLGVVAAVAHGLGLETWQLLIPNLPKEHKDQIALAQIVRAFAMLGPRARSGILHAAETEARGEHKFDRIFGVPLPKVASFDN